MFNRPLLFLGVLAAAVVVPYVLLDDNLSKTAKSQLSRLTGKSGEAKEAGGFSLPWLGADEPPVATGPHKFVASQSVSLEEALRFDITPPWVAARWPQVSTVVGDAKHMGLRVALVSGTQPGDVAGSLTYYFNDRHELERITLEGLTGDERRLVEFGRQHFGLKPTPTIAAGLYIAGDPAKPTSKLRVLMLPIVRADSPLARVQVSLDVNRTDGGQHAVASQEPTPSHWQSPTLPKDYRRW